MKALVPRTKALKPDGWDQVIALWLHGRPESTCYVYRPVIQHFKLWVKKPIGEVKLKDLQDYSLSFKHQKPRTVTRKLCTVKSLLSFAEKLGIIPFNVGGALRLPKIPNDLAEKILPADEILKMIDLEPDKRNKVLLRVLYAAGIRASEAAGLCWKDVQTRGKTNTGQITVLGKGAKTRSILVSPKTWKALLSIRPKDAGLDTPVFPLLEGSDQPLSRARVTNIVRAAAQRAGIPKSVSAHWLRHGHATHALDAGVPLPLIAQTMGHASIETTSRYLHAHPDQSSATSLGV